MPREKIIIIKCQGECGSDIASVKKDSTGRYDFHLFSEVTLKIDRGYPELVCPLCTHATGSREITKYYLKSQLRG